MHFHEALRLLALREVANDRKAKPDDEGDLDYSLRRIFRTYSKRFATPLHLVETLPLSDVLQHYFESEFEEMDEDELRKAIEQATLEPEDLKAAQLREDEADYQTWQDMQDIAREEKIAAVKAAATKLTDAMKEMRQDRGISTSRMSKEATLFSGPAATLPDTDKGISMSFANEDEPNLDGGFGLLDPPRRPQS